MEANDYEIESFLIIDVEGSPVPTEIGAILCDFERQESQCLLIKIPPNLCKLLSLPLKDRTITSGDQEVYMKAQQKFLRLNAMLRNCDVVLAHNASYDKRIIIAIEELKTFCDKKWVCTMHDFEWPNVTDRKMSLQTLCDMFKVEHSNPHKAFEDCRVLYQCLAKVPDFYERLTKAFHNRSEKRKRNLYEQPTKFMPIQKDPQSRAWAYRSWTAIPDDDSMRGHVWHSVSKSHESKEVTIYCGLIYFRSPKTLPQICQNYGPDIDWTKSTWHEWKKIKWHEYSAPNDENNS